MESRFSSHSDYFSSMVVLIPQQFYTVKDQDQETTDNKYWVNKKQTRAPKQAVKEASKKAKRLKLDPGAQRSQEAHTNEFNEGVVSTVNGETEEEEASAADGFSVEKVQSSDLNDLQERLKHKIEELRGKRKTRDFDNLDEASQKKLKRVERKKRKKELRQKLKTKKQQKIAAKSEEESTPKRPCVKDEESGRLVFSKFDFTTPQAIEPSLSTSGSSHGKILKKDYHKLLARAEAAQKKLDEIKEKDQEKAEELQEKLRWQKAVDMAKGKKLKDDPQLLKKTMKRIEKKKAKSREQWDRRQKMEDLMKEKRQEKRKKNIKQRTDKIKAKKLKKRRPGF